MIIIQPKNPFLGVIFDEAIRFSDRATARARVLFSGSQSTDLTYIYLRVKTQDVRTDAARARETRSSTPTAHRYTDRLGLGKVSSFHIRHSPKSKCVQPNIYITPTNEGLFWNKL